MDLEDRVAMVTGGSGGLGRAISVALARAGADVAVTYRSARQRADETCRAVEAAGRRAASFPLDQADPGSVETAVQNVIAHFGGLDVLVNNAGAARPVPFADLDGLTPEIWDALMHANLRGPFLVTRAAAPHLRKSDRARIVNVGAMIGFAPAGSSIAQAVSKAGVIHLTRCLAVALAPDITVNCVAPGLMEGTRMTSGLPEEYLATLRSKSILGKSTTIDDVAQQVLQYCRAESVTGQTMVIDGGIHFH